MLFGFVLCGPLAVGFPQSFVTWQRAVVFGVALGLSAGLLAILSNSNSERAHKVVWAVVAVFVSVTVLDVGLRPLTASIAVEPDRTYEWPGMPLVTRFAPNVRYHGRTYGGLAASAGMPAREEFRDYTFVTDRFGFRNDRLPDKPLDVITLGDSFTVGYGTTQDLSWPAVLSTRYGLTVYNLGISGTAPWNDYANLLMEIDRLPLSARGTVAIWTIYEIALLRPCGGIFDKQALPRQTGFRALRTSLKNFRQRSPLGQIVPRLWERLRSGGASRGADSDVLVRRYPNGHTTFLTNWNYMESLRSVEEVRSHPYFGCVRETLAAAKKLAKSKNIALGVQWAPGKNTIYHWLLDGTPAWSAPPKPSGMATSLAEACHEQHIPFLDLTPALSAEAKRVYDRSGGELYWRDDTHWNVEGNDAAARIAHQFYVSLRSGDPPRY